MSGNQIEFVKKVSNRAEDFRKSSEAFLASEKFREIARESTIWMDLKPWREKNWKLCNSTFIYWPGESEDFSQKVQNCFVFTFAISPLVAFQPGKRKSSEWKITWNQFGLESLWKTWWTLWIVKNYVKLTIQMDLTACRDEKWKAFVSTTRKKVQNLWNLGKWGYFTKVRQKNSSNWVFKYRINQNQTQIVKTFWCIWQKLREIVQIVVDLLKKPIIYRVWRKIEQKNLQLYVNFYNCFVQLGKYFVKSCTIFHVKSFLMIGNVKNLHL